MTTKTNDAVPVRGETHDALSVFLGEWRAEGTSSKEAGFDQPFAQADETSGRRECMS